MYDTTKKKCSSEAFGSGCKMHKNKSGFHRYKADVAISLSNLGGILDREELMISFYWKCQNVEIIMQDISSLRDINTDKGQFHLRYFSVKINVNLYFNQLRGKVRVYSLQLFPSIDVKILTLMLTSKNIDETNLRVYRWKNRTYSTLEKDD